MKRLYIPVMAVLALPFSCTVIEEPVIEPEQTEGRTTHLVISASPSDMTKSVLNEDNSVSFVEIDALSVFDLECQNCPFTVKELYPDGSADFEGDVTSTDGQMAVMYPYQKEATYSKYGPSSANLYKVYFEVPAEQQAVEGSFDPAAAFSFGTVEYQGGGIAGTTLTNRCALVKFTMPEGSYSKVTLTSSSEGICGECYADVNSGGVSDIHSVGGAKTVTLSGEIDGGKTYLMSVVPCTAQNGITVRIYDANGDLAGEKSTTKPVTFSKGRILNIGDLPTARDSERWLGEGTQASPYIIATPKHLEMLADAFSLREKARQYAGKYFKQTCDINMDGKPITIGNYADRYQDTSWEEPTAFNAHYDGGGHTISDYRLMFIDHKLSARHMAGLFNIVSDATISNLNLRPALYESKRLIDGVDSSLDYYYIGLLAAEIDGVCTITNCHALAGDYIVTANDEGSNFDVSQTVVLGGLVGITTCPSGKEVTFRNCTNEANLMIEKGKHKAIAGGIIGTDYGNNHYQYIDRCRNKGNISVVSGNKDKDVKVEVFAGGIAGRITDDGSDVVFRISNCVNEGEIRAESESPRYACAGGIAGSNDSDGWATISFSSVDPWVYNCLNKGDIHAKNIDSINEATAGGIFGYCYDNDTHLALCVNVGQISADGNPVIGPICGTKGDHLWCFWLETDEFTAYTPGRFYHCYPCIGFILGNGPNSGTPEYVRLHGKASDDETGDTLFDHERIEWDKSQWTSAAAWKGNSDSYWDDPGHMNTLDLDF